MNNIMKLYMELLQAKRDKLALMRSVRKYLDPDDKFLSERIDISSALVDTKPRNIMENYSLSSLTDLINPVNPWFDLNIPKKPDIDEEELREWAKTGNKEFLIFINNSSYYQSLIQDKRQYDLYGFTGMSFYSDIDYNNQKKLSVKTENPYQLLYHKDSYDKIIKKYFYVRFYATDNLLDIFKISSKKAQELSLADPGGLNSVLCAFTPNTEYWLKEDDKPYEAQSLKNFCQSFWFLRNISHIEDDLTKSDQGELLQASLSKTMEIGERKYFDEPPTVITLDSSFESNKYGIGIGKRIITNAKNLNMAKESVLTTVAHIGKPSLQFPIDIYDEYDDNSPGSRYPLSHTGQDIKPVPYSFDLKGQIQYMQHEVEEVKQDAPIFNPPEKKSRQSQFEVEQNFLESQKQNMIFKILYITDGVSLHLSKMFNLAIKLKKITPPPEGLMLKDIKPSLSTILLKEYAKQTALQYVQALSYSQGYLSLYQAGIDNLKMDSIIRKIFIAMTGGADLEDLSIIDTLRKQRAQKEAQEEQFNNALRNAQLNLLSSQAHQSRAMGDKALDSADFTEESA